MDSCGLQCPSTSPRDVSSTLNVGEGGHSNWLSERHGSPTPINHQLLTFSVAKAA